MPNTIKLASRQIFRLRHHTHYGVRSSDNVQDDSKIDKAIMNSCSRNYLRDSKIPKPNSPNRFPQAYCSCCRPTGSNSKTRIPESKDVN